MKKITLILVCSVISQTLFSQENQLSKASSPNEMNTILRNDGKPPKISMGYFIEISAGQTQFGSHGVFLPGFSLGIILDHHWTIGLTSNFIDNPKGLKFNNIYYDSVSHSLRGADLKGGYGGILLEYTLLPKSRIHVAFPLMIGDGYLFYTQLPEYSISAQTYHYRHHAYISIDNCLVIEPGARLEFNIVSFIRLGLTLCYRYTPDLKLLNTSGDLINQFTCKISLRFGQF
jgi:hypothetical protein